MLRQIELGAQNGPITNNGVLPVTTLFIWKFCFCLKTFYKVLIWCTNDQINVHIPTFLKCWSFIWGYFFLVNVLHWLFYDIMEQRFYSSTEIKISKTTTVSYLLRGMRSLISGGNSVNIQWRRINTLDFILSILQMFTVWGRITFYKNSDLCKVAISRQKSIFSVFQFTSAYCVKWMLVPNNNLFP